MRNFAYLLLYFGIKLQKVQIIKFWNIWVSHPYYSLWTIQQKSISCTFWESVHWYCPGGALWVFSSYDSQLLNQHPLICWWLLPSVNLETICLLERKYQVWMQKQKFIKHAQSLTRLTSSSTFSSSVLSSRDTCVGPRANGEPFPLQSLCSTDQKRLSEGGLELCTLADGYR